MKPIAKKVIEAGLVPKHTLMLMKRWGYMDPEDTTSVATSGLISTEVGKVASDVENGFTQLVEELDELLEAKNEEDIKETKFSITLCNPFRVMWLTKDKYGNYRNYGTQFVVFHDEADRLIFPASEEPSLDSSFEAMVSGDCFHVENVTPLWSGDLIIAYQVETRPF